MSETTTTLEPTAKLICCGWCNGIGVMISQALPPHTDRHRFHSVRITHECRGNWPCFDWPRAARTNRCGEPNV